MNPLLSKTSGRIVSRSSLPFLDCIFQVLFGLRALCRPQDAKQLLKNALCPIEILQNKLKAAYMRRFPGRFLLRVVRRRRHFCVGSPRRTIFCKSFALCGTRTHDLGIRNPLLYPAELRAHLTVNPAGYGHRDLDGTLRESSGKSRLRPAPIVGNRDGSRIILYPAFCALEFCPSPSSKNL